MDSSECTDAVMEYLGRRLSAASNASAAVWAEQLRESVSVPVQYLSPLGRQPRTGKPAPIGARPGPGKTSRRPPQALIIRSSPGEPPRKEFGDYYDSITHETTREGDLVITRIGSRLPGRGPWLEFGTDKIAPRPHFAPLHEQLKSEAVERIKGNLTPE